MGWCGGTDVFDNVLDAALPLLPEEEKEAFIERVAETLWDGDWDCEADSKYYELLYPIMKKRGYVDDDDDDWDDD